MTPSGGSEGGGRSAGRGAAQNAAQSAARVAVLDYGSGNIRSVSRAAEKAGAAVAVVTGDDDFDERLYDGVVLPGQGHFGQCVRQLKRSGLDVTVRDWIEADRPFLGICVGMQILALGSDEDSEHGLGIVPRRCIAIGGEGLSVPHMGWDQQTWPSTSRVFAGIDEATRFYYCHSYAIELGSPGVVTTGEYGRAYTAAIEIGNVWAVQFHPEKSSSDGLAVWRNFLKSCKRRRGQQEVVDLTARRKRG